MASTLIRHLRSRVGQVLDDAATLSAYSADASNYRRRPLAVCTPRDDAEVAAAVQVASDEGLPVTCRGAGTSIAGNAVGPGLVLDLSRHLASTLAIHPEDLVVEVQAGAVLGHVNAQLRPSGLVVGPDPSTASRCTIGGMLGNNACGAHSVAWGTTADITLGVEAVLADARQVTLRSGAETRAGSTGCSRLDAALAAVVGNHLGECRTELGRFSRQVSGYRLHDLLPERRFDVPRAFVGSEGTWAIATSARLRVQPRPAATALLVVGYDTVYDAADAAPAWAAAGALTVEGMDAPLVDSTRARGEHPGLPFLPPGQAWLLLEFPGSTAQDAARRAAEEALHLAPGGEDCHRVLMTEAEASAVWALRRDGAGGGSRLPDGTPTYQGWEDAAVPAEHLGAYLRELHALLRERGRRGTITGHFGEGCIHQRIDWPLDRDADVAAFSAFITDAHQIVLRHGGVASGEHGDGRARSELLERTYSPRLVDAFAQAKKAWDPAGLLNPGVVVEPDRLDQNLRVGPGKDAAEPPPGHAFPQDAGSTTRAVHRCVGVGSCRMTPVAEHTPAMSSGNASAELPVRLPGDAPGAPGHHRAMCPTYQATRHEVHSTRGRARILGELMRGSVAEWAEETIREALESCLACRACATSCPAGVDVATYKAEYLHQLRVQGHIPRGNRMLGALPRALDVMHASRWGGAAGAWGAQLAGRVPALRRALLTAAGLDPHQGLPPLPAHAVKCSDAPHGSGVPVTLWADSFTRHFAPQAFAAASRGLVRVGYEVHERDGGCCGLTRYAVGDLDGARRDLRDLTHRLAQEQGALVVLEPSCAEHVRTAPEQLLPGDMQAQRMAEQVYEWAEAMLAGALPAVSQGDARPGSELVLQTHCHTQAAGGQRAEKELIARLGGHVVEAPNGCCGLAGSFGYQPGHAELSTQVAERELYPALRRHPSAVAVAPGFSCRTQVQRGGFEAAVSLAEWVEQRLA